MDLSVKGSSNNSGLDLSLNGASNSTISNNDPSVTLTPASISLPFAYPQNPSKLPQPDQDEGSNDSHIDVVDRTLSPQPQEASQRNEEENAGSNVEIEVARPKEEPTRSPPRLAVSAASSDETLGQVASTSYPAIHVPSTMSFMPMPSTNSASLYMPSTSPVSHLSQLGMNMLSTSTANYLSQLGMNMPSTSAANYLCQLGMNMPSTSAESHLNQLAINMPSTSHLSQLAMCMPFTSPAIPFDQLAMNLQPSSLVQNSLLKTMEYVHLLQHGQVQQAQQSQSASVEERLYQTAELMRAQGFEFVIAPKVWLQFEAVRNGKLPINVLLKVSTSIYNCMGNHFKNGPKSSSLPAFLLENLLGDNCELLEFVSHPEFVLFRINDELNLAKKWGRHKNKDMCVDHFLRALRYYYEMKKCTGIRIEKINNKEDKR